MAQERSGIIQVRQTINRFGSPVLGWFDGNGNGIDIRRSEIGHGQTSLNGLLGKGGGMLDAIETFFLDNGRNPPIDQQTRRGVVKKVIDAKNIHNFSPID